jgi:hypothetical protein
LFDVVDPSDHLLAKLVATLSTPPAAALPIINPAFCSGGIEDFATVLATHPLTPTIAPVAAIALPASLSLTFTCPLMFI